MIYPGIMKEISGNTWAMTAESFSAMISIIQADTGDADLYKVFHGMDKEERLAFIGNLGDRPEGLDLTRIDGNVGILDIDGPIVHRASGVSRVSGLTSVEGLGREFQELEGNEDIETVILMLNTPGGVVSGTSEFVKMVALCKKRVIAYVYGVAASSGYWIASAADKIISSDVGIVGGIGTMMKVRISEDKDEIKIVSSQSPYKNTSLKTKDGKQEAQNLVDDLAQVFIDTVAKNRGISSNEVLKNYGQGKIFVAGEALKRGMIDGISTLSEVIKKHKSSGNNVFDIGASSVDDKDTNLAMEQVEQVQAVKPQTDNKRKGEKMTLKEFLEENPGAKAEIDALINEAVTSAVQEQRSVAASAAKILGSKAYEGPISQLAIDVINGKNEAGRKVDISALDAAVAAVDHQAEKEKSDKAKIESAATGDISGKPIGSQVPSEDGVIKNENDLQGATDFLSKNAYLA